MTTIPPDAAPAIPPRFRTAAYFTGLAIGGATILATNLTAAVAPEAAMTVLAICGAVSSAATFVLGGLGVAFRPTVGESATRPSAPVRIDGDTWGDGTPVTAPVIGDAPVGDLAPEFR